MLRDSWTLAIRLTCLIPAVQKEIHLVKIVEHYRKSLEIYWLEGIKKEAFFFSTNVEKVVTEGKRKFNSQAFPADTENTSVKGK